MSNFRSETLDEISDMLDSLSEIKVRNIFRRVSTVDLVEVAIAIRAALAEKHSAVSEEAGT